MKRKRILIIGSSESIYIKQYIEKILDKENFDIYLTSKSHMTKGDRAFYESHNVTLVNIYKKIDIIKSLPFISNIWSYKYNLKKLAGKEKLDYIHIHYVGNNKLMRFVYKVLKKVSKKLIVTFWGSDILDINKNQAKNIDKLMNSADKIVLSTQRMVEAFQSYYGDKYNNKIESILFGNPIFEEINDSHMAKFNFPNNKVIISIGYNGSKRQRHKEILNIINKLDINIKNKIYIIIQATYGIENEEYIESIKKFLVDNNIQGRILTEFLNPQETKELKEKTDIFIHGQDTDALSSSVLEYIYFGAVVLNPIWIDYLEWKTLGIHYLEYENYEDIFDILKKLIGNKSDLEMLKSYNLHNREVIEKNFTWKANYENWNNLYND